MQTLLPCHKELCGSSFLLMDFVELSSWLWIILFFKSVRLFVREIFRPLISFIITLQSLTVSVTIFENCKVLLLSTRDISKRSNLNRILSIKIPCLRWTSNPFWRIFMYKNIFKILTRDQKFNQFQMNYIIISDMALFWWN